VDYVVLQEHSDWYQSSERFDHAMQNAADWNDALRPLNEQPVLFEVWADDNDSTIYKDKAYSTAGKSFDEESHEADVSTNHLGKRLGLPVWKLLGLEGARTPLSCVTLGMAEPAEMEIKLAAVAHFPMIKVTLGGPGDVDNLRRYMKTAVQASPEHPILIDKFLDEAIEIDVDALCDGTEVVIGGIMEHIEEAGVHSGDSSCVLPARSSHRWPSRKSGSGSLATCTTCSATVCPSSP